jgi:hypothetical protein
MDDVIKGVRRSRRDDRIRTHRFGTVYVRRFRQRSYPNTTRTTAMKMITYWSHHAMEQF